MRTNQLRMFMKIEDQWIGLRENLQETIDFPMKIMGLKPVNFPLNQSIDHTIPSHAITIYHAWWLFSEGSPPKISDGSPGQRDVQLGWRRQSLVARWRQQGSAVVQTHGIPWFSHQVIAGYSWYLSGVNYHVSLTWIKAIWEWFLL